jgi:pyroglutamyl-peptidase
MPTILATGFLPFPSAPVNPTEWLIRTLEAEGWQPEGARLVTHILPTVFDVYERSLKPMIDKVKPDAVVQFGLSAKANGFTLERTAYNMQTVRRPDGEGAFAPARWIEPMAPATHISSLPLPEIAQELHEARLPVEWSDSAGDYMCNLVFYRCRVALPHAMTGFIHLPYTVPMEEEALACGAPQSTGIAMSEASMLTGAKIILGEVARALPVQA